MTKRHWRIIYKNKYNGNYEDSILTTKDDALTYMNIFGDAVAIQKVSGWFKRFIIKPKT